MEYLESYIRPSIISDIDLKVARLNTRDICKVKSWIYQRHFKEFEREACSHSYKIEHPTKAYTRFNGHGKKRQKRNGERALGEAHRWGLEQLNPATFDEDFIRKLAGKIDPKIHYGASAEYRMIGKNPRTGVEHYTRIRMGSKFTPPSPDKIEREMGNFTEEMQFLLSDNSIPYILTASAYSHLHMARIHPFEDTNGRTARALQNIILRLNDLPPPVIFQGERFDYYRRLENAMLGWRSRTGQKKETPSEGERDFYEYIAGRVSSSLDKILD